MKPSLLIPATLAPGLSYLAALPATGQEVTPGVSQRPVTPCDIAPTLSARLGVRTPSGAVGQPLAEIVQD